MEKSQVSIIGQGIIGRAIYKLLFQNSRVLKSTFQNIELKCYDTSYKDSAVQIKNFDKEIPEIVKESELVVSCTPYTANKKIAKACADYDVTYIDLTEDTAVLKYIQRLKQKKGATCSFIPQCGIAPGAVNVIAHNLAQQFNTVRDISLKVGALPRYPSNRMRYYLTWSTEGVINEYCNPCDAILDGEKVTVQPLQGLEDVIIDGASFEAFNTSGGVGTLCETYKDKVKSLTYKTVRYPGHHHLMQFLLEDMNLRHDKKNLAKIWNAEIPYTLDDFVIVNIKVVGTIGEYLTERTYNKIIYGDNGFSAIQLATASGACAVIYCYLNGDIEKTGFVKQEDISYDDFINNPFGEIFKQ